MPTPPRGVKPTQKPMEDRLEELEDAMRLIRSADQSPEALLERAWPEQRFWQGGKHIFPNMR